MKEEKEPKPTTESIQCPAPQLPNLPLSPDDPFQPYVNPEFPVQPETKQLDLLDDGKAADDEDTEGNK